MSSELYAEKLKSSIEDVTECPICTETMKDARMLPCVHSFCLKCLQELGARRKLSDQGELSCPVCRKSFKLETRALTDLPVNHFINKLIDASKASQPAQGGDESGNVVCDPCLGINREKVAEGYCMECREHLCMACLQRHNVMKVSSSHKTVTMDQKPNPKELLKISVNLCHHHKNQDISLYCYDCNASACVVCYISSHKEHKCKDIKTSSLELRQQLDQQAEKVAKYKIETEYILKQVESTGDEFEKQIQITEAVITTRYDNLKALLTLHHSQLIQEINELKLKRKKELQTLKEGGEHKLLSMLSFERYWGEVKERGSECDVVQAASDLTPALELIAQHDKQHSDAEMRSMAEYYKVEFIVSSDLIDSSKNLLGQLRERVHKPACEDWRPLLLGTNGTVITSGGNYVNSVTIVGSELFLLKYNTRAVAVYNVSNPAVAIRHINVTGMTVAGCLAHDECSNCLYASSQNNNPGIFQINLADNSQISWKTQKGFPYGLSISRQHHLLVSIGNAGFIEEYDGSGLLVRSVNLSGGITGVYHAIELNTGQLVVCQISPEHRICLIDSSGSVIRSIGRGTGGGVDQFCNPNQVEVDQAGNLLIADTYNNKLRIFSSNLEHLGDISPSSLIINTPRCFCWDNENNRLIVGTQSAQLVAIKR